MSKKKSRKQRKKGQPDEGQKNKPITLAPLDFEEAVEGLLNTPPKKKGEKDQKDKG